MPETPIPPDKSLASELFNMDEYSPEERQKKEFLPWHKPRKQFVRHHQWCEQIHSMLQEFTPENKVLRYLGLPGEDLLDLRYFHSQICAPLDLKLKFLGFNRGANRNSGEQSELNLSLDEINKLGNIDPQSDIIGDDICQLAIPESVAWNRTCTIGPYDVINIDLCDGFGKHGPNQFRETHYNALHQLMTLQARKPAPWLLLLTTRTSSADIHEAIMTILKGLYNSNLTVHSTFREASFEKFGINDEASLDSILESEKGVSDIFLVSLCKWIASIAVSQNPPSKLEVKSVLGYKVAEQANFQDLVSIAIKITPTFIVGRDAIGLSNAHATGPNECQMAIQALNRIARQKDVDDILSKDEELLAEMISMSAEILKDARYDVSTYPDWARNK